MSSRRILYNTKCLVVVNQFLWRLLQCRLNVVVTRPSQPLSQGFLNNQLGTLDLQQVVLHYAGFSYACGIYWKTTGNQWSRHHIDFSSTILRIPYTCVSCFQESSN